MEESEHSSSLCFCHSGVLSSTDVGLVRRQVTPVDIILSLPLNTNDSSYKLDQEELSCMRGRDIASQMYPSFRREERMGTIDFNLLLYIATVIEAEPTNYTK